MQIINLNQQVRNVRQYRIRIVIPNIVSYRFFIHRNVGIKGKNFDIKCANTKNCGLCNYGYGLITEQFLIGAIDRYNGEASIFEIDRFIYDEIRSMIRYYGHHQNYDIEIRSNGDDEIAVGFLGGGRMNADEQEIAKRIDYDFLRKQSLASLEGCTQTIVKRLELERKYRARLDKSSFWTSTYVLDTNTHTFRAPR